VSLGASVPMLFAGGDDCNLLLWGRWVER